MNKEESIFLESGLLEQYALGLCNPVEMMEVEQMLESSALVSEKYEEIQDNFEKLAKIRAVRPPEEVRSKVLDFLNEEAEAPIVSMKEQYQSPSETPEKRGGSLLRLAAGLALLICLSLLYTQWNAKQELLVKNEALQNELEGMRSEMDGIRTEVQSLTASMNFINDAETKKIKLADEEENDLRLIAYWNDSSEKAVLDISNMPNPPQGKCYQLWADVHGEMLSVAVISKPSSDFQEVRFYEEAESLNITLEDAPGSDHATVTALVTSAAV
ncbi:MAG: anti-sigma factor [Flavobacteriales bacterium]|nr:anti-sigma factor [Flavobacteriales bacterium]